MTRYSMVKMDGEVKKGAFGGTNRTHFRWSRMNKNAEARKNTMQEMNYA